MDKIDKALNKLAAKERNLVKKILTKINNRDFTLLDLKKLSGRDDIYRIRKGQIRIIFIIKQDKSIVVLNVERKSDNTYK